MSSESSSSSEGNIFLENIALFRQYSLDADLIDLYFNKGTSPELVDLNLAGSESSSSSSGDFSISIDLEGDEDIFGDPFVFPEDMEFYFYDETVDGTPAPGTFNASKAPGQNKVVISFASSSTSGSQYEFQVNIEHPTLLPISTKFTFSDARPYLHQGSTSTRRKNSVARLQPSYINSLAAWINDFWSAYDANPASPIPEPPRPAANLNTEFDPFAHARWKVRSELGQMGIMAAPELEAGKGWRTVRGWNFLGVEGDVWNCIIKPGEPGGLYQIYYPPTTPAEDIISGKAGQLEKSFDCRSFTAAAAYALKDQLSEECEASVNFLKVGQSENLHALILVEMNGCKEESGGATPCDCCSGSFIYEPQSGATFRTVDDYCKKEPKLCLDKSQWRDVPIEDADTNNFGNPDWENDPAEMDRIKNVICGCMTGNYAAGSAEAMIKDKCQSPIGFKNWFKNNFAWEPGRSTTPMTDMPSILSCKRVVCEMGRDPEITGPMCTQEAGPGETGITPYQCEIQCQEKWNCYEDASPICPEGTNSCCLEVYSLNGINGDYEEKEACLNGCSDDKACVYDWLIKFDCETQTWTRLTNGNATKDCLARDRFQTSSDWEPADDLGCNYRKVTLVMEASCENSQSCPEMAYNDPSAPSGVSTLPSDPPSNCCGSWCEIDQNFDLTGNCIPGTLQDWIFANENKTAGSFNANTPCGSDSCPTDEKTRSIRFYDF